MKKVITLIVTFLFTVTLLPIVSQYQEAEASPQTDIVVLLDGLPLQFDVPPQIVDGRTLVPLRFFSEAFNCQVEWVNETRTVKIISPPRVMEVIGFYALGGDARTSSWTNLFGEPYPITAVGNTKMVSELALGWYTIDEQGNLLTRSPRTAWQRPPGWEDVLAAAQYYNLRTEMVVHEENRDGMLYAVLNDEQAVENLVGAIVLEAEHFHGVNINFEGLGLYAQGEEQQQIRDRFTHFIASLAPPLQDTGKTLTLTLHPPNNSFRGYDYLALGKLVDRIIIMAHDYGPKPEPLWQIVQAIEMALTYVPREKLVLALSVPEEPPENILSKVRAAKHFRLQGISLWRLGLLTEEMWDVLEQTIKTEK